jgi:hypothetical protein
MMIHTDHSLSVMHSARVDSLAASASASRASARAAADGSPPGRAAPGSLRFLARGFRRLPFLGGRSRVQGYPAPDTAVAADAPSAPVPAAVGSVGTDECRTRAAA